MNIKGNHPNTLKYNSYRLLSSLVLIASPWIVLFITTRIISGYSVQMSIPVWNDEMIYWHEILSFSAKCFDFGYYTMNEIQPRILSFGTHGFGTITPYTLYALLFGWDFNSMVIANNLFVSAAFLFLVLIIRPGAKKTLLVAIFYITYVPVVLYTGTSMSELMNQAAIIIYITLLYYYIEKKHQKTKVLYALAAFCIMLCLIRIIYIVLFLPVILNESRFRFNRRMLVLLAGWVVLSFILFYISSLFVSPFPEAFLNGLFSISQPVDFIVYFFKHLFLNIARFIYPFRDGAIQISQRYFIFAFTVWLFVKSGIYNFRSSRPDKLYFVSFVMIFMMLAITIVAYDVHSWRDYRVLSPVVFGIILLLTLSGRTFVLKNMLWVNAAGLILIAISPGIYNSFFFDQKRYTEPAPNRTLNEIRFTQSASSRFENTMVVDRYDEAVFLNVPAGIGISHADTISDKLKSKYIFTSNAVNLTTYKIIASSEKGILYEKRTHGE